MNYYELPRFLSDEQHKAFLTISENVKEWTPYQSTVSGNRMGMYYFQTGLTFADRNVALIKLEPNDVMDWHVDGKRNTALSYPLSDNYAPCSFEDAAGFDGVMLLNTQARHAVFNNEHIRYSINISFQEPIDEAIEIFNGLTEYEFKTS
jgi:hypothetical protein